MSTLALMRWLEAAPGRYDVGMRLLTLGQIATVHRFVAVQAVFREQCTILEIGCGTGMLTTRLAGLGANVVAIDQNPALLERARARARDAACLDRIEFHERTASEIDAFQAQRFDAVVATFALSEMSRSERRYVLAAAHRVLRPDGLLIVADEVLPAKTANRLAYRALRAPQAALGVLLTDSVSHPIANLAVEIENAGFRPSVERHWLLGSIAGLVAAPSAEQRESARRE